jgi:hypothetical protein
MEQEATKSRAEQSSISLGLILRVHHSAVTNAIAPLLVSSVWIGSLPKIPNQSRETFK